MRCGYLAKHQLGPANLSHSPLLVGAAPLTAAQLQAMSDAGAAAGAFGLVGYGPLGERKVPLFFLRAAGLWRLRAG